MQAQVHVGGARKEEGADCELEALALGEAADAQAQQAAGRGCEVSGRAAGG